MCTSNHCQSDGLKFRWLHRTPQKYIICFNEILPLIVSVSETEKQVSI